MLRLALHLAFFAYIIYIDAKSKSHLQIQYNLGSSYMENTTVMEKGNGVEATRSDDEELEGNATTLRIVETFLRLLPIGLCVTSLLIMLKNSQDNDYGSIAYTDLGAFRYLVHANGICAGYSLLSAAIVALPRASTMPRAWTFFLLDQVLTYIILAAGAVSTEVLYLADRGNTATMWSSACGSFGPFCHKVTASIAITFVAVVCYIVLSLISSYNLFSKFDAPASNPTKNINIAAFHG
ncbi:CASP-like protein 2A2 [Gastrolobium bilobum]|uniref:CASP-like protein 2A2 n=1 Tax=Gastrolobium bilobum TaxID=150636 RepID=UPI002AB28755|nr:CASP-like protein 2A2 [Gastrolobium bilobum]